MVFYLNIVYLYLLNLSPAYICKFQCFRERKNLFKMGGKSKSTKKKLPIRKSESETENTSVSAPVDVIYSCCLPAGE